MLDLSVVTAPDLAHEAGLGGHPFAIIGFPEDIPDLQRVSTAANVGLTVLEPLPALWEVWSSQHPVETRTAGDIRYSISGPLLFGVISIMAPGIQAEAQAIYASIFRLLGETGFRHALRFWNYIPRINAEERGVERYRLFNMGRHEAFAAAGYLDPERIPAASAVGAVEGQRVTVCFLASRSAGAPIENPRQMSAYHYPREYGPRSPTFARALAYPAVDPTMLFVSGTSSIVGHRTLHAGDVALQTRESLANVEAVFEEARKRGDFSLDRASFKFYLRHAEDAALVRDEARNVLGDDVSIVLLNAEICRADLSVEVEAFCGER